MIFIDLASIYEGRIKELEAKLEFMLKEELSKTNMHKKTLDSLNNQISLTRSQLREKDTEGKAKDQKFNLYILGLGMLVTLLTLPWITSVVY